MKLWKTILVVLAIGCTQAYNSGSKMDVEKDLH